MNTYAVIILAALLLEFILSLVADLLNLKRLGTQLPQEFADLYDPERYRLSQKYERVKTRFGLLESSVNLILLLLFWFLGGFNRLQQAVADLQFDMIVSGLLFLGAAAAASALVSLPFDLYFTFVIEERFGFNRTTLKTFLLDRLKGALLGLSIGAPLTALVLYLFQALGSAAWLYAWAAVTVFSIALTYLAPSLILPLFNTFRPLPEGPLREALIDAAKRARFPLHGIYLMDGSRRSSKGNAFFTGLGRRKRIALFDTLLERQSAEEIAAIVAHEIGHYKKKHVAINLALSIAHSGVIFFLLSLFLYQEPLYRAFFMESTPLYAGFLFFGLLYSPVELLLSPLLHALSRRYEYRADAFAASLFGNSEPLISALKKLSTDHLANLTPHPFYVFLHFSHPPLLQRIEALRALMPAERLRQKPFSPLKSFLLKKNRLRL